MLGLTSTADLSAHVSANARRKVFYAFANGAAPMTGLLSLADTDPTDKAEWSWYEQRDLNLRVELGRIGTAGPMSDEDSDTAYTTKLLAQGTVYRFRTATDGTDKLRPTHSVWLKDFPLSGGGTTDLYGVVTKIVSGTKFEMKLLSGAVTIDNQVGVWATATDRGATIIGTANPEGSGSSKGLYDLPELTSNYTQIFKTPFSSTGTSLQEGMIWDDTGHFQTKAWRAMRDHAKEMEYAALFGLQSKITVDNGDGDMVPQRTMQGVYSFLRAWDAAASATTDADPNKRIIANATGVISLKTYNGYMERLFEQTNDKSFVKICFCGATHISTLNEMWGDRVTVNTTMLGDDKMRFRVAEVETIAGTIIYKTHPLFTNNPDFKAAGIYLDINNLRMVPLNNRDTTHMSNIQAPDKDYRKDQWLTEIGLEMNFPDSCMWINNLSEVA